jgi:AcrR family transcriptional regulator
LREGGVGALNIAEAGRRLGVSSAAPYKHFADKRELLRAVAAEGNRRLGSHSLSALVRSNEPLTIDHPVIAELSGRALAHGPASLFVNGVLASIGIDDKQARRLARAVVGLEPEQEGARTPSKAAKQKPRAKTKESGRR